MENKNLTLGSLFDGSGGFPLGGLISGITPIWSSEIEPFPIRVTTKRLPQVKHYGDISKMNGAEIEPVDIITFGSPCQDMSIAGKRDGLGGSRSSLFYEAVRIIKEMRCKTDDKYPRFIVWENVPGAFSSNNGEDFRAVLEEICKIKDESVSVPKPGKWNSAGKIMGNDYSVAWRQFDAQFWGVPQRRKRIYLVADFAGWCAGKILFESEGLSGYSPKSISSWKGTAATVGESAGDAGIGLMFENHGQDCRYTGPLDVSQTVLSTYGTGGNNQPFIVEDIKSFDIRLTSEGTRNARNNVYETDTSRTIDTSGNSPDSNQGGVAVVAYGICSKDSNSMKSANPNSGFYEADTSRTLDGNGGNPSCNQGGIAVIEGNGSRPSHKGDGYKESDVMYTLNATEQHAVAFADVHATLSANDGPKGPSSQMMGNPHENFVGEPAYGIGRPAMNQGYNAKFSFQIEEEVEPTIVAAGASGVAHPIYCTSKNSHHTIAEENIAGTLVASDYKDPPTVTAEPKYIVRRLTPTECARLQGFPSLVDVDTKDITRDEVALIALVAGFIVVNPNTGDVYGTRGPGGTERENPVILKGSIVNGYKVYSIHAGGVKKQIRANRLVWMSVYGAIPEGYVVDHINNDKLDNRIDNLQLLTPEDNSHKAKVDGLYPTGDECASSKLTEKERKLLSFLYWNTDKPFSYYAEMFGISNSRAQQIIHEYEWANNLETENPTDEDISLWREIFQTHADAMGKKTKPKSDNQIRKWLLSPHSDSAEYKMWGNGCCLNNIIFVLCGIAYYAQNEAK